MRKSVLLLSVLAAFHASGQDFEIMYSFSNVGPGSGTVAPGPLPQAAHLSVHTFTAFGVSDQPSASGRLSFTGWPTGSADQQDDPGLLAGQLGPFSYYEVLIEASAGYKVAVESVAFTVRRSSTGPRTFCLRSSADQFSENLAASTGTSQQLTVLPGEVFFWKYDSISPSSDLKGCETAPGALFYYRTSLALRVYAWNAESSGGSFSVDNFTIRGKIADTLTLAIRDDVFSCRRWEGNVYEVFDMNGRHIGKQGDASTFGNFVVPAGLYIRCPVSGSHARAGKFLVTGQ